MEVIYSIFVPLFDYDYITSFSTVKPRVLKICEHSCHNLLTRTIKASAHTKREPSTHSTPSQLSTKCRQLEKPKWKLPKKFPFWHRLNVKGGIPSPSPLHNPPMRVQAWQHRFVYRLEATCGRLRLSLPVTAAIVSLQDSSFNPTMPAAMRATQRPWGRVMLS